MSTSDIDCGGGVGENACHNNACEPNVEECVHPLDEYGNKITSEYFCKPMFCGECGEPCVGFKPDNTRFKGLCQADGTTCAAQSPRECPCTCGDKCQVDDQYTSVDSYGSYGTRPDTYNSFDDYVSTSRAGMCQPNGICGRKLFDPATVCEYKCKCGEACKDPDGIAGK